MKPISEMNEMMHMIISSGTTLKIEPFSGKVKDFPRLELKQISNFVMADMGHVLGENFAENLPSSETTELDPKNPDHKAWIEYRQQNARAVAAIVAAQES